MRCALLLLTLLAPLAVAAPVPKKLKEKLSDFYPLADGTNWVYEMGQTEVTVRATEFKEKDGTRTAKLVTEHSGKQVATEGIRVDKEGVFRTHINDTEVKPPLLMLNFGLADEESWVVKTEIGVSKVDGKFTLKGVEKLKLPGGEYEAVRVDGECNINGTGTATKWWLADGVGIVKLEYNVGGTTSTPLELKKYTPGKAEKK